MSKKILVDSRCSGCGLCFGNPYLEEMPDGKAKVKGLGILAENDETSFKKVADMCPVNALSVLTIQAKTRDEIKKLAQQKIESFSLHRPTLDELKYDCSKISFPVPTYAVGQDRPQYSSYNSAKRAAEQAIDQAMFSQRGVIIKNIINDFIIEKLTPYIRYDEIDSNFYYASNRKAKQILTGIASEMKNSNPNVHITEELLKIETRPEEKKSWIRTLTEDILYLSDVIISREMSGSYYRLSDYADYCDIDSEEVYAGTTLFGNDKYVDKWYFSKTRSAFEELAKDIRKACDYSFNDVVVKEFAVGITKSLVDEYERKLKDELKKKIDMLNSYL